MTDTATPDLEALTQGLWKSIPILGQMGARLVALERGYVAAELPAEPNGNHFGVMYAGSLFSAGEFIGGAIGLSSFDLEKFYPTVKDVHIRYRRPAVGTVRSELRISDDELARIEADAAEHGKAEFVLEATITDESGEVVATTTGTYQLRRK